MEAHDFIREYVLTSFFVFCSGIISANIVISSEPSVVGLSNGSIVVVATGSSGPFRISIVESCGAQGNSDTNNNPVSGTIRFDALAAGFYFVKVIDRFGCQTCEQIEVEEKPTSCDIDLFLSEYRHVSLCDNCNSIGDCSDDGILEASIVDPNEDYIYTWTYPDGSQHDGRRQEGLAEGFYELTVSGPDCSRTQGFDLYVCSISHPAFGTASGCSQHNIYEIAQPVISDIFVRNVQNGSDGSVTADIDNLNEELGSFYWEDESGEVISETLTASNLEPGRYYLVINNGCADPIREPVDVYDCRENPVMIEAIQCTDFDLHDFDYTVMGGVPFDAPLVGDVYKTDWIRVHGEYTNRTLIISDARGCSDTYDFVHQKVAFFIQYDVVSHIGIDGAGLVDMTISSGAPPFVVSIEGQSDQTVATSGESTQLEITSTGEARGLFYPSYERKVYYQITDANGCVYEDFIIITSCEHREEFRISLGFPDQESTGREVICTDDHLAQITWSVGNLGPFDIRVVLVENYTDADYNSESGQSSCVSDDPAINALWCREYSFDELPEAGFLFENLPSGRIEVYIKDVCNNGEWILESTLETCKECVFDLEFDPNSLFGGREVFTFGDDLFGLRVIPRNECSNNDNGELDLDVDLNEEEVDLSFFPITITWHNGLTSIISFDGSSFSIEGPDKIENIIPGSYFSRIERADGCSTTFEYEFQSDETPVVGFSHSFFQLDRYGDPWDDAYFLSFRCGSCLVDEESTYLDNSGDCDDVDDWEVSWFEYFPDPNGVGNLCDRGGTVNIHTYQEDGTVSIETLIVPANSALDSNYFTSSQRIGGLICIDSDLCLFDGLDILGYELDRPLVLVNCNSSLTEEEYRDWLDGINDGIPTGDECFNCEGDDKRCIGGICVDLCENGNCPAGFDCDNGICVPSCDQDFDFCPNGFVCDGGRCVDVCENVDCGEDMTCIDGECIPINIDPCERANCASDRICVGGICELDLCEFNHRQEPTHENFRTVLLHHDLPIGSTITIEYCTSNVPDILRLVQNGDAVWVSGCESTGECNGAANITTTITITDPAPLRFSVSINCNTDSTEDGSSWNINISCDGSGGLTDGVEDVVD